MIQNLQRNIIIECGYCHLQSSTSDGQREQIISKFTNRSTRVDNCALFWVKICKSSSMYVEGFITTVQGNIRYRTLGWYVRWLHIHIKLSTQVYIRALLKGEQEQN
jgi:hypothetical protein